MLKKKNSFKEEDKDKIQMIEKLDREQVWSFLLDYDNC